MKLTTGYGCNDGACDLEGGDTMWSRGRDILNQASGNEVLVGSAWVVVGFLALTGANAATAAAQPETAQTAYQESCAECHGTRLQGGAHGPALTGLSFNSVWSGRSPDELRPLSQLFKTNKINAARNRRDVRPLYGVNWVESLPHMRRWLF